MQRYGKLPPCIIVLTVFAQHFYKLASEATHRDDLVRTIDAFLNDSLVVPPGEIDERRTLTHNELLTAIKKQQKKVVS